MADEKKAPLTISEVRRGGLSDWGPLVSDLTPYRFESDIFDLTISDKNPYLEMWQMTPGTYQKLPVEGYLY